MKHILPFKKLDVHSHKFPEYYQNIKKKHQIAKEIKEQTLDDVFDLVITLTFAIEDPQ